LGKQLLIICWIGMLDKVENQLVGVLEQLNEDYGGRT
jgi:hypothetical protein